MVVILERKDLLSGGGEDRWEVDKAQRCRAEAGCNAHSFGLLLVHPFKDLLACTKVSV